MNASVVHAAATMCCCVRASHADTRALRAVYSEHVYACVLSQRRQSCVVCAMKHMILSYCRHVVAKLDVELFVRSSTREH
eukprot:4588-Heterococcus_DN1.PRE.3